MAENRKPLADELGIPFYGQLMGMATGTEEDIYDAAYISRQYGLESKFKDEDRTSDSLRHILLGGLVYGDDSKESLLGQAGRGIAGFLADFREGDTPEDIIDLNNNEFGRKLREKYPDREEFIAKAKEIADAMYADEELPEIDGISPQKSYGAFETPERLAKFEEENKKQVMEIGPDGTWQFTDQARKEREAAGLDKGGLMSDLYKKIPVNARAFIEFALGEDSKLTEEDFSQEDLQYLSDLVAQKQKENDNDYAELQMILEAKEKNPEMPIGFTEDGDLVELPEKRAADIASLKEDIDSYKKTEGKTSIGYDDYDTPVGQESDLLDQIVGSFTDPAYRAKTTLGHFNAYQNDDGSVTITDDYNWTKAENISLNDFIGAVSNAKNLEHLGNMFARLFRPDSSRDVEINLPPREMANGGLMAADGVDVSKSAEDLLDEFNVFEGSTSLVYEDEAEERDAKVYDDPVAQKMNRQLDTAFRKLFNKRDKVTREDYAKTVQVIRNQNPEVFDKYFLGPNTDAKIEALNYEAFSDNPLPHMDEEAEAVQYTLNIPFGSENELTLGGNTGLRGWARPKNKYDDEEIFVSGKGGEDAPKRSSTARHEVRHLKHGRYEGRSSTWEEDRMRALDALDAVLSQDQTKIQDIFDLEYGDKLQRNPESFPTYERWFENTLRERLQNAVNLLPELYRDGVFDKSKADKNLVKQFLEDYDKDEQGFVDSLLGNEPEKQTEIEFSTSTTDAKKLAKILSVAPFVEESKRGGSSWPYRVNYKIDREATGMNDGGLMQDPLVLSETAEEEAEPKMSIGEYTQAAMDLVEDFSPAGTAQSMIDAAEEAYKLATGAEDASFLDLGMAALGALPGGKTAGKAIKVADNATKIADEIAEASLEISKLDNYVPKKTVKAYKLFTKGEDDNLYPLFVDANNPLPVGEWIKANMPDYIFQAKNGRYYVPSKATAPKTETGKKAFYDTGERKATGSSVEIPDDPELRKKLVEAGFIAKENTKSVKAVAARPGWHAGDVPIAHHIGAMIDPATGGTKKLEMPNVRRDDQVWAEVELPADVDWQQEALRRANVKKNGEIDVGTAHVTDMVPHGGSYRYKTNPNMTGEWLIGGELKINRVLDDAEVKAINEAAGVQDLPRYSEFMDQYVKAPTETGIMSAEGAVKKSPTVDMAINVRVDKKADLDYAEKLISGEKVYETRNSRSLDPYIGQRVGIAKTGDGKAQAIGSVEIGEPIEVDEKTFRELQDKHLVPEGSAFDVPKGGKKYLYPVSNPERFESPKDVGRGIVSRKIVNKYAGGLMLDDYNRAES